MDMNQVIACKVFGAGGQRQVMSHLRTGKIQSEEHSICFAMSLPNMPILNLIIEETSDKPIEELSTIAGLSSLEASRSGMSRKGSDLFQSVGE